MTIDLGTQGTYDYLLAKYNVPNRGSEAWYVGDLTGIILIPVTWDQYDLSGWAFLPAVRR